MSQTTTTPSGAELLALLDTAIYWATSTSSEYARVDAGKAKLARTAVAALIARNAELEAQTPSALREKLRSCERALATAEAERDALRECYDDANRRATAEQEAKVRAMFERDALAAELKALKSQNAHLAAFIGPSAMPRLLDSLTAGLPAGGADQPLARASAATD